MAEKQHRLVKVFGGRNDFVTIKRQLFSWDTTLAGIGAVAYLIYRGVDIRDYTRQEIVDMLAKFPDGEQALQDVEKLWATPEFVKYHYKDGRPFAGEGEK